MKPLEIADRYSQSIFELAQEAGTTNALFQELAAVRDAMFQRPELLHLLRNPLITRTEKHSLIEGILGPLPAPRADRPEVRARALAEQFLNLLVAKNRIDLYPTIIDRLHLKIDDRQGLQEATTVTARELHPSILQLLQKALEKATAKKIVIRTEINPDLIGGIQIRMGNRLIDGSLRSKLHELETQLSNIKV